MTHWVRHAALVWLLLSAPVLAEVAPPAAREPSFAIEPAAAARVSPIARERLMSDETFVKELRSLLSSRLSPVEKVDAFSLMLEKIGWLFAGKVNLPPGFSYARLSAGQSSTFLLYQQRLTGLEYYAPSLLPIAQQGCAANPVRCSNAILLAALLDRKACIPAVRAMLRDHPVAATGPPTIVLHGIARAVLLARDFELKSELAARLPEVGAEEEREEILIVISRFQGPDSWREIQSFVEKALGSGVDNAVQTGIAVLKDRLPAAEFEAWYEQLQSSASPEARSALATSAARGFDALSRADAPNGMTKVWDGFEVVVYDDGLQMKTPDGFSYFSRW